MISYITGTLSIMTVIAIANWFVSEKRSGDIGYYMMVGALVIIIILIYTKTDIPDIMLGWHFVIWMIYSVGNIRRSIKVLKTLEDKNIEGEKDDKN